MREERQNKGEAMREIQERVKVAAQVATGCDVESVEFVRQTTNWLKFKVNFVSPHRFTRGDMKRIKINLKSHGFICFCNIPNIIGIKK